MHQQLIDKLFHQKESRIVKLSGGDINHVYKVVDYKGRNFVLKVNDRESFPDMLVKEAHGLEELKKYSALAIPTVLAAANHADLQYLLMEYIDSDTNASPKFWARFGSGLAEQHKHSNQFFGFEEDNYIGSLPQSNRQHKDWTNFFIEERIIPQVKRAYDTGIVSRSEQKKLEVFCSFVDELWPVEKPSLLHGDLWSGNYLIGQSETPYLIDPAVYYGHREIDIGMMHLFGGFNSSIFKIYDEVFPLEKGWEKRIEYNKIYPLLVHLNLFGRSYLGQLETIIKPFN